jgi:hypothetical protein
MMAKAQSEVAKFDVKVEDSTLRLSFAMSEEELKKAIAARSTGIPGPPKVTGQPASPARPQVTTPGGTSVVTLPGKNE